MESFFYLWLNFRLLAQFTTQILKRHYIIPYVVSMYTIVQWFFNLTVKEFSQYKFIFQT